MSSHLSQPGDVELDEVVKDLREPELEEEVIDVGKKSLTQRESILSFSLTSGPWKFESVKFYEDDEIVIFEDDGKTKKSDRFYTTKEKILRLINQIQNLGFWDLPKIIKRKRLVFDSSSASINLRIQGREKGVSGALSSRGGGSLNEGCDKRFDSMVSEIMSFIKKIN